MANRSMYNSQEINDSIDSNSFDHEIQHADLWDEMYDYMDNCECDDSYKDFFCF
jgi:hypothetical protein